MRATSTDPQDTRLLPTTADREMLRWAVEWLPFGTGDEYILPEFGVTPAVFYHRIYTLISTGAADHIQTGMRTRLRERCSDRNHSASRMRSESPH